MSDERSYDPAGVLAMLPRKGPEVRGAIDWWLDDVAPKLEGLRLLLVLEPPGDLIGFREPAIKIRMRAAHLLAENDIAPLVARCGGDSLRRAVVADLEAMHRNLIDLARQDPEQFRRMIRHADN